MDKLSGFDKAIASLPDYVRLDYERCRFVAHRLIELYHERGLESIIPERKHAAAFEGDPLNHRRFLVISSAQDAMKPSEDIYSAAVRLMKKYPYEELLVKARNPRKRPTINQIADQYFGSTEERKEGKTLNSSILFIDAHSGDPLNAFRDIDDFDIARRKLRGLHGGIYGVGRNISTLIVKNFVRFGYFTPKDMHDFPIKIDRHATYLSIANRVVEFTSPTPEKGFHRERLEKALEAAYRKVCSEDKIDPILLDDAKWAVGSRVCHGPNSSCPQTCGLGCSQLFDIERRTYVIWPAKERTPLLEDRID